MPVTSETSLSPIIPVFKILFLILIMYTYSKSRGDIISFKEFPKIL